VRAWLLSWHVIKLWLVIRLCYTLHYVLYHVKIMFY
jgi:hypothetical protein